MTTIKRRPDVVKMSHVFGANTPKPLDAGYDTVERPMGVRVKNTGAVDLAPECAPATSPVTKPNGKAACNRTHEEFVFTLGSRP